MVATFWQPLKSSGISPQFLEIHRRFLATRDCFLNKGDVSGDRYDAVLLFAAGAFAGAVFINGEPVVHKVIKKYVIRAKQGKAQSTNDLRKQVAMTHFY